MRPGGISLVIKFTVLWNRSWGCDVQESKHASYTDDAKTVTAFPTHIWRLSSYLLCSKAWNRTRPVEDSFTQTH